MSDTARIAEARPCDICKFVGPPPGQKAKVAQYDGKTKDGPWANMCQYHWKQYGPGRLGTGYGQRLLLDTCGHQPYTGNKCAEMSCPNYVMKSGS